MRIENVTRFLLLLITCMLPACSQINSEDQRVPTSATIDIQQTLRTRQKTVRPPKVVEINDPVVLRELRDAFRVEPDEASGGKTLWTAIGSITVVDEGGEKVRFLIGDTHWAKTGDDVHFPLPEGFKDRLIEVIEANHSK